MKTQNPSAIKQAVREKYGKVATSNTTKQSSCCSSKATDPCCSPTTNFDFTALKLGYSETDLAAVPEGANLGLGCGNPQAIAKLKKGETVLDLGSGGGFDVFLAARQVGESGRAIGVDMTAEMVQKARENLGKLHLPQVDFRLGEIEHLPVADQSVDVIISNCVINLSTNKPQVFHEAFRVLKPGGRLAVSDIVTLGELPESVQADMELYTGCISGASSVGNLSEMLRQSGFIQVKVEEKAGSRAMIREWDRNNSFSELVMSANIEAVKPIHPLPTELSGLHRLGSDKTAEISQLLDESDLPADDIEEAPIRFWGIYHHDWLVALGGLEIYGSQAILRSVAIRKAYRSAGLGGSLLAQTEQKAIDLGLSDLYLLTTTAEDFFAKHGYHSHERSSCPPEILESSEFKSICPSTASCMHKKLIKKG